MVLFQAKEQQGSAFPGASTPNAIFEPEPGGACAPVLAGVPCGSHVGAVGSTVGPIHGGNDAGMA